MDSRIDHAVAILHSGGLVAFPTETVYGLGADAASAEAVNRIFIAKGRPTTNPIIVHVADEVAARKYAGHWPDSASQLARRFWPGPLTLVVPRSPLLASQTSAGRNTVGLRAPDHPLALQLLRAFGGPIAAPSANRSTRVSPTTADHVREELGGAVDLILDGGPCRVGIESTVLDLSSAIPTILRLGNITRAQIESEIGAVELFTGSVSPAQSAVSPGQHAIHYAPQAPAYRFDPGTLSAAIQQFAEIPPQSRALLQIGASADSSNKMSETTFGRATALPADPLDYARALYAALRELDQPGVSLILVELPPDEPKWAAVRDRLTRATKPITPHSN